MSTPGERGVQPHITPGFFVGWESCVGGAKAVWALYSIEDWTAPWLIEQTARALAASDA
jgi:hypothetical protein